MKMFVEYKQILLFTALILVPQCKGELNNTKSDGCIVLILS